MVSSTLDRPAQVLLAVSGSIAAYKAADIVSLLRQRGCAIQCLLTEAAREFVSPLVLETLSGHSAQSKLFGDDISGTEHIRLARWADVLLIAPATADLLARLSLGLADDLVTTVALATEAPWIVAPAMNTVMWSKPIVREHVETLKRRGARFVEPVAGTLACGEEGIGKLASPEAIADAVSALTAPRDLDGVRLLITSGPTIGPIDAVRYLTNHSSGKMGAAIAEAAAMRGAQVTCVLGVDKGVVEPRVSPLAHGSLTVVRVKTASEMRDAALAALAGVDGVIAAAAVLDYEPAEPFSGKLHRSDSDVTLRLRPAPDVLGALRAAAKPGQWFVGFAAETGPLEEAGRAKMHAKRLDMLFVNRVAALGEDVPTGFGADTNEGLLLWPDGTEREIPLAPKGVVANRLLDAVKQSLVKGASA